MPRVSWNDLLFINDPWVLHGRLLDLLEPHLEKVRQDWLVEVDLQAERIEDEYTRELFYEFHSEEYHEQMEFKVILMNSLFATSFASFENQLIRICRVAKRNSSNPSSVCDLRSRSPTDRAKTCLTTLGIEFPSDSDEWQNINRYREIRNKIMHNGARLGVEIVEGDLARFARQKGISTAQTSESTGGRLELTRTFCDEAGEQMNQFLREVYRSYRRWRETGE